MSKAEKFILDHTNHRSNIIINNTQFGGVEETQLWLTPNQARRAVEIAREETLQEVKTKLQSMLQTSIDNKHFFEQLDDYIEELENKQ